MELTIERFSAALGYSLQADQTARQEAEDYLKQAVAHPDFLQTAMTVVRMPELDKDARVAGAVLLKNAVKVHWEPPPEGPVVEFPAASRQTLINNIFDMYMSTRDTPNLCRVLEECMAEVVPWNVCKDRFMQITMASPPAEIDAGLCMLYRVAARHQRSAANEHGEDMIRVIFPRLIEFANALLQSGKATNDAEGANVLRLCLKTFYVFAKSVDDEIQPLLIESLPLLIPVLLSTITAPVPPEAVAAAASTSEGDVAQQHKAKKWSLRTLVLLFDR
eukprot:GHVU01054905.1.p2 GENE.GHVU01054905.1~~GHVU01054905.1.p2  ORF type:complete len:276 (+),score=74.12 GHVU01054905.1:63-890(+)